LKPRPVDARNASSSVESRTTLDAKPTLDDDVVDEAPPGVQRDLGSRPWRRGSYAVVALIACVAIARARRKRARRRGSRAVAS